MQQQHDFFCQLIPDPGNFELDDLHFSLRVGKIQIEMEAAPFQSIGHLTAVVAGQYDERNVLRLERADLGHGDLKIAQYFEQKGLELRVRLIHLVDEQNGLLFRHEGAQQRPRQQETVGEENAVLLGDAFHSLLKSSSPL